MTYSIQAIIQALVAPKHRLSCHSSLWFQGLSELKRRGEGLHESGAFLLGYKTQNRRIITKLVYYDDLDPHALDSGYVIIDGGAYGKLWKYCREERLEVIGDIHTHPGLGLQSLTDKRNPMIGNPGHIAIIVPDFAEREVKLEELGIYEYQGNHRWKTRSGRAARKFFNIGLEE